MAGGRIDIAVDIDAKNVPKKLEGALGPAVGKLAGFAKKSALAVGVAATAALAGAVAKGVSRLSAIEEAEGKLAGLGHSATTVTTIMDNALASVKGTAFGLGDAATIAASAVAAGIKPGQDLERTLKLTGDAATIAGVDIQSMGAVFNKVASANKITGGEIMQLNKMGIPIVQLLGKEMGKTAEEVRDMAKKGKVDFATFQNAMERGLGGAALESGATVKGAFANMNAAVGRFGATLVGPFYNQAKSTFGGVTALIDDMDAKAKPIMERFGRWIERDAIPGLKGFAVATGEAWQTISNSDLVVSSISRLRGIFNSLWTTGQKLGPSIFIISKSLATAAAATGVSTWSIFLNLLESGALILDATLVPALKLVASLMESHQGVVTTAALAWLAFRTVPALLTRIAAPISALTTKAAAAGGGLRSIATATGGIASAGAAGTVSLGRFGSVISAIGLHRPAILRAQDAFMGAAVGAERFGRMAGTAAGAMSMMKSAGSAAASGIRSITSAMGGVTGISLMAVTAAVMAASAATSKAKNANDSYVQSAKAVAKSQEDVNKAFSASAGAVNADVVDAYAASMETKMDALESNARNKVSRWEFFGGALQDIVKMDGWNKQDELNSIDESANRSQAAIDTARELGITNEDLARAVTGTSGAYMAFSNRLDHTTAGGQALSMMVSGQRLDFQQLQKVMEGTSEGAAQVGSALDVLGNKASSAADKSSALKSMLEGLGIIKTSLPEALGKYGEEIDKLVKGSGDAIDATDGLGKAMLNADGTLNTLSNAGARDLNERIVSIANSYMTAVAEGGDANALWAEAGDGMAQLAEDMNLPIEAIHELLRGAGMVPDKVTMAMALEGADASRKALTEFALHAKEVEGGKYEARFEVKDEGARDTMEALGLQLSRLDKETGMVTITAENSLAMAAVEQTIARMDALGVLEVSPEITADSTKFNLAEGEVMDQLRGLDGESGSPSVDAVIEKFIAGKDVTLEELKKLDLTTAKPEVIAIVDEAIRQARIVSAELDKAAADRRATIRVEYFENRGGPTAQGPMPDEWKADGGKLPKNAAGSRLPTTGPGTEVTDGFLGVSRKTGAPISWLDGGEWIVNAESSEKYSGLIAAINRDEPWLKSLPKFELGGRLGGVAAGLAAARSKEGNLYDWGGIGPDNFDCSGFVGWVQQIVMGVDQAVAASRRLYTTHSLMGGALAGLVKGRNPASPFHVGVNAEHMAATVDNVNVESGGRSSPSTSGIGPGRAGAFDSQFGSNQYHLPVDLIAGDYTGAGVVAKSNWTETNELSLQSARIAVEQAKNARDKAMEDPKKPGADKEQAQIKVAQAEQKVRDLEGKKAVAEAGGRGPSPDAPELTTNLTEEEIGLRRAELAVKEAEKRRNDVYADIAADQDDRARADLDLMSARNALIKEQEEQKNQLKNAGVSANSLPELFGNAAKAAVTGQLEDALGVVGMDGSSGLLGAAINVGTNWDDLVAREVPSYFSDEEIASQWPVSKGQPGWMERLIEAMGVPTVLRDMGGPLPHGMAALNLSGETEHVQTAKQKRDQDLELAALRAGQRQGAPTAELQDLARSMREFINNPPAPMNVQNYGASPQEVVRLMEHRQHLASLGRGKVL